MKTTILLAGNSAIERPDNELKVHLETTPIEACLNLRQEIEGMVKIVVPFDLPPYIKKNEIYNQSIGTKDWNNPVKPFSALVPEIQNQIPFTEEDLYFMDEHTAKKQSKKLHKMYLQSIVDDTKESLHMRSLFREKNYFVFKKGEGRVNVLREMTQEQRDLFELPKLTCAGVAVAMVLNAKRGASNVSEIKWIRGKESKRLEEYHLMVAEDFQNFLDYSFSYEEVPLRPEEMTGDSGCSI